MENQLVLTGMSEVKVATDGRKYFTATLSAGFGQKDVSRNFWQQFRKDQEGKNIPDSQYWERGTPEQAAKLIADGTPIAGKIVTARVAKYEIGGNLVDSYTTVIFPGEKPEAVFASNNHPMVDENTGEELDTRKKKVLLGTKIPTPVEAEAVKA